MNARKTCFVVQGLGQKTDYHTGRLLNLDASYLVIKDAVQEAGLDCLRVDEVMESPDEIDKLTYEWLFKAELVIADLSTSNLNAAYELGVRFGLRPRATIVVAEDQFQSPFDFKLEILDYKHLGPDIGRREAERFKARLRTKIASVLDTDAIDSPVYQLASLNPPEFGAEVQAAHRRLPGGRPPPEPRLDRRVKRLLDQAQASITDGQFAEARTHLMSALEQRPDDVPIIQRLALAVYKSRLPDPVTALQEARTLLTRLFPGFTSDPETLGLWGAVHKQLWEAAHDRSDLDTAIAAYERGFYLGESYYAGINLAYLYDVRASVGPDATDGEGITDAVLARRIRRAVLTLGERALEAGPTTGRFSALPDEQRPAANSSEEERSWIVATLLEAAVGIGDDGAAAQWEQMLNSENPPSWIRASVDEQIGKLRALLARSPLDTS
jgi:tetratricopeptide (TPR) repeat protein